MPEITCAACQAASKYQSVPDFRNKIVTSHPYRRLNSNVKGIEYMVQEDKGFLFAARSINHPGSWQLLE
jgi:hypothetical protein